MMEEARRERHRVRVATGLVVPIARQRELAAAAAPGAQEEKEDTEDEAVNFLMSMSGGNELRVTRQVKTTGSLGVREVIKTRSSPALRSKRGKQ